MTKVFINAKGTVGDITPELKKFLKMVSRHEATDDFTRKLQEIISCVKDGLFSEEVGAKRAGLPLEEFRKRLAN